MDFRYPPCLARQAFTDPLPRQNLDPTNPWKTNAQNAADHGAAQNTACPPSGVRHSQKDARGRTVAMGMKMTAISSDLSRDFSSHLSTGLPCRLLYDPMN